MARLNKKQLSNRNWLLNFPISENVKTQAKHHEIQAALELEAIRLKIETEVPVASSASGIPCGYYPCGS